MYQYINLILYDLSNIKKNKEVSFSVLVNQIFFTGCQAFPVVAIISLILGAAIIREGHFYLGQLGQSDWIYKILVSSMVRDVGPIIISFIILARSGTAISTELGYMVVNREIDALKSLGISPISYLITPRIIGMILSLCILVIYFAVIGVFGGYIVSIIFNPLPFTEFFNNFIKALTLWDLLIMMAKMILSGFFISVICSYQGLSVSMSLTEIPQRNIKSFVQCFLAILFIHFSFIVLYLLMEGF